MVRENNGIERRTFRASELRAAGDGDAPMLVGHAAVFDELSEDLGGWKEKIAPGAFKKSLDRGDDVRALWNHDPNFVLGRSIAKTLRLAEDKKGLAVEIDPPETAWAKDLLVTVKRGDVSQMSFAFQTVTDRWNKEDGVYVRTLVEANLFDVSPVTYPAYPQTDVGARALEAFRRGERAVERERRRRRLRLAEVV